ncbi:MAG TPA: phage holin family protein [Steroidobacteraceae bacterium]|nr:phage holin family protein [Steroidobacteraceae bacterium]
MADAPPETTGLIASLRRVVATLIELARTRLELVSVEIEEQIEYAAHLVLWGAAAMYFGSLALLLLAITVVIAFWDTHRLLAACLVTGAFAIAALVAVLEVRRRLRERPRLLSATTEELRRDAAALHGNAP